MHYDYKCSSCGNEFDDFKSIEERQHSVCPKCNCEANIVFSIKSNKTKSNLFRPYVDEHLTGEPILIESESQRKQLMKEHGLVDFAHWRPGSKHLSRWI